MGYNSTFSGSLTPSKPIPEKLVARINNANLDVYVVVAWSDDACEHEPGDVVPWASEMHGYNWVEDIVKVQRLLAKHGIALRGDIYRSGESDDDFDKVEVRKGRVYYRPGRIVYGKREEKTADAVTFHAIRVFRVMPKSRNGLIGWVAPKGLLEKTYPVYPVQLEAGKPVTDRPPTGAMRYKSYTEAWKVAEELGRKTSKRAYDVVTWEETL